MLACIGNEWKLLTWLRYSLWIPLYPLGVVAEGLLLVFHVLTKENGCIRQVLQLSLLVVSDSVSLYLCCQRWL